MKIRLPASDISSIISAINPVEVADKLFLKTKKLFGKNNKVNIIKFFYLDHLFPTISINEKTELGTIIQTSYGYEFGAKNRSVIFSAGIKIEKLNKRLK